MSMQRTGSRYTVTRVKHPEVEAIGVFDQVCDAICYIDTEMKESVHLVNPAPVDKPFNEIGRYEGDGVIVYIHLVDYYRYQK